MAGEEIKQKATSKLGLALEPCLYIRSTKKLQGKKQQNHCGLRKVRVFQIPLNLHRPTVHIAVTNFSS